jgi:hypothetical protein
MTEMRVPFDRGVAVMLRPGACAAGAVACRDSGELGMSSLGASSLSLSLC